MSVLDKRTLVLNKGWQPVHISTVRDAIVLLFKGVAKAVCPDTFHTYSFDDWLEVPPNGNGSIATKTMTIAAPHVIVLIDYDKVPIVSTFSKRNVYKRDKYTCQYCGKQGRDLTIDHIVPKSKGGESKWKNVVAACEPCNKRKADKSLEEARMRLLKKPVRPSMDITYLLRKHTSQNPIWSRFVRK